METIEGKLNDSPLALAVGLLLVALCIIVSFILLRNNHLSCADHFWLLLAVAGGVFCYSTIRRLSVGKRDSLNL